jgi:hypothetical protein
LSRLKAPAGLCHDRHRQSDLTDERTGLDPQRVDTRWQEQFLTFRAYVEPTEPMRGLEVPQEVVDALGGGRRPTVTIAGNWHSWKSRVAIMRGRYLLLHRSNPVDFSGCQRTAPAGGPGRVGGGSRRPGYR